MTADHPPSPLIAVGDNCLDVFLSHGHMAVGGNALNVAVQWRRAGLPACYFGRVGRDGEAEMIAAELARNGLDPADLETGTGATAVTLLLESAGDREFLLEDLGAGLGYVPDAARLARLGAAAWVHLGTNSSPALLALLAERGIPFSVDLSTRHDEQDLAGAALAFAAGSGSSAPPADQIARLLAKGARQAVVTCGAGGAWFHDGEALHHAPAERIEVVDTCGAGDSFIAAFLAARVLGGAAPGAALARATQAAAATCLHPGGFPQPLHPVPDWLLRKYSDHIPTADPA
ncbi:PfkB family carbohydrate kinase [Poseidonocella sp. HB161398]|uniref:PfkB family carbohydrate kinase n=1 Tax=Poseidonocella sp. HB161398 TaxID=2320855 RepID=UPI0011082669|nr:PfkB family carbohydrate kinase [Poseidonocella sp. HB161398]